MRWLLPGGRHCRLLRRHKYVRVATAGGVFRHYGEDRRGPGYPAPDPCRAGRAGAGRTRAGAAPASAEAAAQGRLHRADRGEDGLPEVPPRQGGTVAGAAAGLAGVPTAVRMRGKLGEVRTGSWVGNAFPFSPPPWGLLKPEGLPPAPGCGRGPEEQPSWVLGGLCRFILGDGRTAAVGGGY